MALEDLYQAYLMSGFNPNLLAGMGGIPPQVLYGGMGVRTPMPPTRMLYPIGATRQPQMTRKAPTAAAGASGALPASPAIPQPADPLAALQGSPDAGVRAILESPEFQAIRAMTPQMQPAPDPAMAQPQGFWERFAQQTGGNPIPLPEMIPQGFGQGFASGLAHGLSQALLAPATNRLQQRQQGYESQVQGVNLANQQALAAQQEQRKGLTQALIESLKTRTGPNAKTLDIPPDLQGPAKELGYGPAEKISRGELQAISSYAGGRPMSPAKFQQQLDLTRQRAAISGQGAGGAGMLSPEALDMAARLYATTGQLPPLGMRNAVTRAEIMNRAAADYGGGTNIALNRDAQRADATALSQTQQVYDASKAFGGTLDRTIDRMTGIMKKLPDSGSPLLNRPIRDFASAIAGSPDMATFTAFRQAVETEAARVQGSPRMVGQLTDDMRRGLNAVINRNYTLQQMLDAGAAVKAEKDIRLQEYQRQVDEIKGRMANRLKPQTPPLTAGGDTTRVQVPADFVRVQHSDGTTGWASPQAAKRNGWKVVK